MPARVSAIPEVAAWDSRPGHGRSFGVVVKRVALLIAAVTLGTALTSSAQPADRRTCRGVAGPALCLPLPRDWFSSVGPGVVAGRAAAYLLAGNFRFPDDAASHEGPPLVPPHKVLISIGDFPVVGHALHWQHVQHLRLSRSLIAKRAISWHVRFAGRAVSLTVQFGSKPDARSRALVDARLAAVRRIG